MPLPGGYLLDTNILVALIRGKAFGQYLDATYGLRAGRNAFTLCVVTIGEMYALAGKFQWGAPRRAALDQLLTGFSVIDISDQQILQAYGEIDAFADRSGHPMGKNDIWIAATARVISSTILTSDKDFDHLHGTWVQREWVDPASKLTP